MYCKRPRYRWIVLATSAICNGLSFGLHYTVGVLYKDWKRYFDSSASSVSFVGGLGSGLGCVSGPFVGYLLNRFGMRNCGFVGGIIMGIGMATSCLAGNVFTLGITYGLITGFGTGLTGFASYGVINDYFKNDRILAEGVTGGGMCLSIFIISILQQHLSNLYNWKGAMLISGSVCLHASLAAMFFIPFSEIANHPLNIWKSDDKRKLRKEQNKIVKEKSDDSPLDIHCDEACLYLQKNEDIKEEKKGFLRRSWAIWKNPVYLALVISDILTWLAIFIPYVHLVERGRLIGLDDNTSSWLSSTIGLAGVVGRPLTGFVCNYFHFHPLWSYFTIQMACGIATVASSFWSDVYGLFTYAVLFGLLSNGYGFIKASVALLLHPSCFIDAFSWMLMFEGFGIILGPFLAGIIYDTTESYIWSFRFAGSLLILSALMCFLQPVAEQCNARKIKQVRESTRLHPLA